PSHTNAQAITQPLRKRSLNSFSAMALICFDRDTLPRAFDTTAGALWLAAVRAAFSEGAQPGVGAMTDSLLFMRKSPPARSGAPAERFDGTSSPTELRRVARS